MGVRMISHSMGEAFENSFWMAIPSPFAVLQEQQGKKLGLASALVEYMLLKISDHIRYI
jgi:hypothetical protein